jgi:uncharacterized repeat protein (TIGR03803 family)
MSRSTTPASHHFRQKNKNRNRSSSGKSAARLAEAVAESLEQRRLLSGITTLASFNGSDGYEPFSGLTTDSSGDVFGVTEEGSSSDTNGFGMIYEVVHGSGTIKDLASFDGSNGSYPENGLVMDSAGDLFSTAEFGGANDDGVVYELAAGSSTIQDLVTFNNSNGGLPESGLVMDSAGDLFGTTADGGSDGSGTVFEISASGAFSTLADFSTTNLDDPVGKLAIDSSGNLFGVVDSGGADGEGAVWELAAGSGTITTVASFTSNVDVFFSGVADVGGNLFGTSASSDSGEGGSIFEVAAGSGTVTTLYTFGTTSGSASDPLGGLTADAAGNLYGTTAEGGANDEGSIFELPVGSSTPNFLASFNGTDGAAPIGNLSFDSSGNLYGATEVGGPNGTEDGTVYEFSATPVGPPAQLVFTTEPSTVADNSAVSPPISVAIEDANGNVVSSDDSFVGISIASGPANGNLNGTNGMSAVNGVATFGNDEFSQPGTYTLLATDTTDNLTADSVPFVVGPAGLVSFGGIQTYAAGGIPFDVASGDLTGDGTPDIVSANYNGTITVLLNNGNGTFQTPETFSDGLGSHPSDGDHNDVAVANLGTDFPDVLVANEYSDDVAVMIGNGDGTFAAPQDLYVGPNSVQQFAVADLGNGEQDLVTIDSGGNACIFLGNGNGTFSTGQTIPVVAASDNVRSLFVTDINGDGNPDIVLADSTKGIVEVLYGNGNGTFQSPQTLTFAGSNVREAATGTFNGENDLLVQNTTGALNLLLNNGNGTFAPATHLANIGASATGDNYGGFIVGNFAGDGNEDILIGTYNSSGKFKVNFLLGNGNGTFRTTPLITTVNAGVQRPIAADLTGDGKDDIVLTYNNSPDIDVRLNTTQNEAPTFTSASSYSFVNGFTSSFTVTTTAIPSATLSEIGTLPNGVTFEPLSNGSATITGTPQGTGTFVLTLEAFNGIAQGATQTFTLTVVSPPTIAQSTSGLVMISGASASNTGSVTVTNGMVMVSIDGQVQSFDINSVTGVNIALTTGVNNLTIGASVPQTSITGGAGSDTIMATNSASDTVIGGSGDNLIMANNSSADILQGGAGNNTIMGGGTGTIILGKKGTGMLEPQSAGEIVRGGPGIDTISTTAGGDKIKGGLGSLKIFLTGGNAAGDTILGGPGIDLAQYNPNDTDTSVLIFNPPAPTSATPAAIRFGPADPTAAITNGTLVITGTNTAGAIDVKVKNDIKFKVLADGDSLGKFLISDITGISVIGGTGADTISIDPTTTLPATLNGGGGNDSITGGGGDNLEIGDDGSCTLVGGGGTSLLIPGQFQTYESSDAGTPSLVAGAGLALADFAFRTDNLDLSNNDVATGGAIIASNVEAILGGTGKNTIVGTSAGDFLSGGGGKKDSITGQADSDLIVAGTDGLNNIAVGAEPITLQTKNGIADTVTGVNFPSEDIIVDDVGVDSIS